MKEIELSEYLGNNKIKCSTLLISQNWKRLLNSDNRIPKQLDEWKDSNIKITIRSISHGDSYLRSPKEKGYTNFYYDGDKKIYVSYELEITRELCIHERKKYGKSCQGVSVSFDLPLMLWVTVLRADIQHKSKNMNNKCSVCNR